MIFREMMSHPALFTHPHPKTIAILGDEEGDILQEVQKHLHVRVIHHKRLVAEQQEWITKSPPSSTDIVIQTLSTPSIHFKKIYECLHTDGILLQSGASPFELGELKNLCDALQSVGFHDLQLLHFPQPENPYGWLTAVMALKQGSFNRIREKNIFNKPFKTHYYNFDIHKAATVLPEFMRETWGTPENL
jgi:spermidine synthase